MSKTRERGGVRFALEVERLAVARGEFIALVGPSGSGKSTLLDLLGLVLRPDAAGRFALDLGDGHPRDLAGATEAELADIRRRHIGYVLQTGGLLPFLTVRRNIELPARLCGATGSGDAARELAERLGIADQLGKKPGFLSGGQRQRAAIARALVHRPRLVLADEPTAAVDQFIAREIVAQFKRLAADLGTTVIMVSHDLPLVSPAADRVFRFELTRTGGQDARACLREEPRSGGGNGGRP